ncbi:MAG: hypothetical protein EPO36_12185 [Chloroflexota bacterium]|nr:MAG: hypothetical protein EPO36_12185 [Chloroflexota bacterium]
MTPDLERLLGGEAASDATSDPPEDGRWDAPWDALGDVPARLHAAVAPRRLVIGWATVELDRAEVEVGAALAAGLGPDLPIRDDAPDDELLGARCRLLRSARGEVLLLEPSTEGRLAAALARHDEGPLVRFLFGGSDGPERARQAGLVPSASGDGPFGSERLVLGGPRWGPFLLLVAE